MKFEVSSNKIFSFIGSNKEEIHPFWLRERVSEKEYLDEGTQQRLFDPSSMKQTVEIVNAEINGEFLKVKFNDIKLLQVGLPVTKDLVPSIGSITHEKSLFVFLKPYSSPMIW